MTTYNILYRSKSTTSNTKIALCNALRKRNVSNPSEPSNECSVISNVNDKHERKDAFGTPIVKKQRNHRVSFADDFEDKKLVSVDGRKKKKGTLLNQSNQSNSTYVYSQESIHIKCNDIIPLCEDITKNDTKYTIVTKEGYPQAIWFHSL